MEKIVEFASVPSNALLNSKPILCTPVKFRKEDQEATVNLFVSYIQKANSRYKQKMKKRKIQTQNLKVNPNNEVMTPQRLSSKFIAQNIISHCSTPGLPSLNSSKRKIITKKSKSPSKDKIIKKSKFKVLKKILKKNARNRNQRLLQPQKSSEISLKMKRAIIENNKKRFAATRNSSHYKHMRTCSMSSVSSSGHNCNLYSFQPNYPKSNYCDTLAEILKKRSNQRILQRRNNWSEVGLMPKYG
ncbi:unnamed protein product [Moneuplotes crassus]|uniref:Uncharacterized protein n=1 Tax=Euplotes crassus TaxID=5936 RepID=A0AAD2DBR1_EUPCR|nr:unnamed protein product [Moneuplotes crassus]